MNPHAEILTPEQQTVLPKIGSSVAARGFYLGGGTALAIHLGHRQSVDLDIHALGKHGLPLAEMLGMFRRKFTVEDISRVLYSLCCFEDADADPMPRMHTGATWEQAKADIRTWVKAIAAKAK